MTSAWFPQCYPFPKASCVEVHDDDSRNEAIHDEVGNCDDDLLLFSYFACEER